MTRFEFRERAFLEVETERAAERKKFKDVLKFLEEDLKKMDRFVRYLDVDGDGNGSAELFDQFVDVVDEGRPELDRDAEARGRALRLVVHADDFRVLHSTVQ